MNLNNDLIVKMKKYGELNKIIGSPLRTYYTCIRYSNMEIDTSSYAGPLGTGLIHYGPGKWSCIKEWVDTFDGAFQGKVVDRKVLSYCKFRNTEEALKKDINDDFTLIVPKDNK